ncbi:MAG: uroporphyrinogen decarboxylase family protein [Acidobacteria bacterium]|nr:uroporphyrinogen decarboxylase family protein [Acidobacteriota bacterium]
MNSRERVLAMLQGCEVDHLPLMPVTMMFAARQIGAKYRDYATDYRILVEAQLRTAEVFGFDHVSAISDPAREPADCGAVIEWYEDQPPALNGEQALLASKSDLARLRLPDMYGGGRMHDRIQGVALLKERAGREKLVEGWVEGPCAESADLRGINTLMLDFMDDPAFVAELFDFAVEMETLFALAQLKAGADIIGIGDAAASLVGPAIYEEFVWPGEKKMVDAIHAAGGMVRLHICGKTRRLLEAMGRLGCEIVDLDWMNPLAEARAKMGPGQVLLGNIDPLAVLRNGSAEGVKSALAECHRQAGPRYILGAGCEIVRDTPPENVTAMQDYALNPR